MAKIPDDRQEVDVPNEALAQLCPLLEKLVSENQITIDMANEIVISKRLPVELAQFMGIWPHSGMNGCDPQTPKNQSVPIGFNRGFYIGCSSSGFNTPNLSASPNHHVIGTNNSQSFGNFMGCGSTNSATQSPINYNLSGSSSPNPYLNAAATSPMHQITKGISGLSTGGGSITRGTSAASESASISLCPTDDPVENAFRQEYMGEIRPKTLGRTGFRPNTRPDQPLDLSMETAATQTTAVTDNSSGTGGWYVPAQFYDLKPLNLAPAQPVRIVPTPPASPNLCIIQEEQQSIVQYQHPMASNDDSSNTNTLSNDDPTVLHSHPQISVTDVQGSEVTLVALSDHSHDSEDSLDAQSSMTMQGLIISEPSSDMPSITRGVGRKSSLEIENRQETYERRGSDKSLGFSDDSLSNDSNIVSPGHEPSSASSGFKTGDSESRLSPDSLSDSRRMSEDCYQFELPLPHECCDLDSSRIIEMVKQTIDSKMPPKCFILHKMNATNQDMNDAVGNGSIGSGDVPFSLDNLSIEYSGVQIELQIYGGCNKGINKTIKLRRISGSEFEYGKLCQQLISSLTV